jgi:hypothetical protein
MALEAIPATTPNTWASSFREYGLARDWNRRREVDLLRHSRIELANLAVIAVEDL